MKIDTSHPVRDVNNEHIIIRQHGEVADLTSVIALNESAMELYQALKGRDFGVEDVQQELLQRYDVDAATALHDAQEWVATLRQQGIVTD